MKSVTEQDMVEGCRRGDREAQRELFEHTSDRVFRLLVRLTGSMDDAYDLSQDTYLKGFAQIDKFDGHASVATWLYKIAVNEALQFLRRAKSTRLKLQGAALELDTNPVDTTAVRLDVQAALAVTDPSDRAFLVLRYQDRLDYRTIAEIVGCPEGTVASRLSRARDRLRKILQKSYDSREENNPALHPRGSR